MCSKVKFISKTKTILTFGLLISTSIIESANINSDNNYNYQVNTIKYNPQNTKEYSDHIIKHIQYSIPEYTTENGAYFNNNNNNNNLENINKPSTNTFNYGQYNPDIIRQNVYANNIRTNNNRAIYTDSNARKHLEGLKYGEYDIKGYDNLKYDYGKMTANDKSHFGYQNVLNSYQPNLGRYINEYTTQRYNYDFDNYSKSNVNSYNGNIQYPVTNNYNSNNGRINSYNGKIQNLYPITDKNTTETQNINEKGYTINGNMYISYPVTSDYNNENLYPYNGNIYYAYTSTNNYKTYSDIDVKTDSYNGKIDSYNGKVVSYNGKVDSYNGKVDSYNGKVDSYNGKVDNYNSNVAEKAVTTETIGTTTNKVLGGFVLSAVGCPSFMKYFGTVCVPKTAEFDYYDN